MSKGGSNMNVLVEKYASAFKALGNPHRLKIFVKLVTCCAPGTKAYCEEGACVGDLGHDLGIVPSTVSHHIKELKNAGLIKVERKGKNVVSWVDPELLAELSRFFEIPAK
jgi:ArsR family transcriptional regulator